VVYFPHARIAAETGGFCEGFSLVSAMPTRREDNVPRADSFLVLMIFAAYSWPLAIFMQRLTTENAPLRTTTFEHRLEACSKTLGMGEE